MKTPFNQSFDIKGKYYKDPKYSSYLYVVFSI